MPLGVRVLCICVDFRVFLNPHPPTSTSNWGPDKCILPTAMQETQTYGNLYSWWRKETRFQGLLLILTQQFLRGTLFQTSSSWSVSSSPMASLKSLVTTNLGRSNATFFINRTIEPSSCSSHHCLFPCRRFCPFWWTKELIRGASGGTDVASVGSRIVVRSRMKVMKGQHCLMSQVNNNKHSLRLEQQSSASHNYIELWEETVCPLEIWKRVCLLYNQNTFTIFHRFTPFRLSSLLWTSGALPAKPLFLGKK